MQGYTSLKLFEISHADNMPAKQKLSDTPYIHQIRYACCNIMWQDTLHHVLLANDECFTRFFEGEVTKTNMNRSHRKCDVPNLIM